MNQSTKQRIVGTIVLLMAAVILLPVIFDGKGNYQSPLESRIPPPPPFAEPARVIQERPVIAANNNAASMVSSGTAVEAVVAEPASASRDSRVETPPDTTASAVIAPTGTTPAVSESPQLDSQGLPEGWSVRMGAFSVASNATALVETLQSQNLRAYSRSTVVNDVAMQVVYIGPVIDRATAQQLLDRMNREHTNLPGKRIERFEIESL